MVNTIVVIYHKVNLRTSVSPQPAGYGLSERETQILEQMAQRLVNKEIADVLDIGPHTVIK